MVRTSRSSPDQGTASASSRSPQQTRRGSSCNSSRSAATDSGTVGYDRIRFTSQHVALAPARQVDNGGSQGGAGLRTTHTFLTTFHTADPSPQALGFVTAALMSIPPTCSTQTGGCRARRRRGHRSCFHSDSAYIHRRADVRPLCNEAATEYILPALLSVLRRDASSQNPLPAAGFLPQVCECPGRRVPR